MNPQTVYAHSQTDTGNLPLCDQRNLMMAAVSVGLYSSAVDVAKRDKTGMLKTELKRILNQRCDDHFRGKSEDEIGLSPTLPEERALTELER